MPSIENQFESILIDSINEKKGKTRTNSNATSNAGINSQDLESCFKSALLNFITNGNMINKIDVIAGMRGIFCFASKATSGYMIKKIKVSK
jgi:hypothetical protein